MTSGLAASTQIPVLVGVGVASQREEDPAQALDPLALMIKAARASGTNAGAPSLLGEVERILVPKGRWSYGDPGRSLAVAIGADRATTVLATVGVLQQTLIGQACAAIAAGEIKAAMVVGGDCGYRLLRSRITGFEAPLAESGGTPDVFLAPKDELLHEAELKAGLRMPVGLYAILESAFRARRGWSVDEHRDQLAQLYSRFSAVAAGNPEAWTRKVQPPEAIRSASERNPMQAFPYTKMHCASWNVDQAAALLFCSEDLADILGVRREGRVYPWASTESNYMTPVCARADLAACPGAGVAGRAALEPFGVRVADLHLVELYSCFPIAVQAFADELGLGMDRDLTVTGGMAFAGGPFNNYVLQSTARMVELLRAGNGRTGLVSSVSGLLTKQGFGHWSTQPPPGGFQFADVSDQVARLSPAKPVVADYRGVGRIAGYSVVYDRSQSPTAIIVADIEHGRRVVATSDDPALTARMEAEEFCGASITLDGGRLSLIS